MAAGVAAVAAFQLRKLVESLVVVGFIVFGILVKRLILPGDKLVTFLVGLSAPKGEKREGYGEGERKIVQRREEDRKFPFVLPYFLNSRKQMRYKKLL